MPAVIRWLTTFDIRNSLPNPSTATSGSDGGPAGSSQANGAVRPAA
jgi:hypothetical protein